VERALIQEEVRAIKICTEIYINATQSDVLLMKKEHGSQKIKKARC